MCKYCKDFNEEKEEMNMSQLEISGSYYNYECPINFCPNCGLKIKQNVKRNENDKLKTWLEKL